MTNQLALDIGLVMLTEYNDNGILGIQVDGYGEEQAGLASYMAQGACGELARCMDPELGPNGQPLQGKACEVMYAHEGSRGHAWCLNDPRTLTKLPQMHKGEKIVFAPNLIAQFIRFHDTGAISLYTTDDGTVNGKTIKRSLSPDPLQGIVDYSPWGFTKLNVTGYHVQTSGGARFDGGGMSAPGLPSSLGSYWNFQAGTFAAQASVVQLGPTPEAQDAVVKLKGALAMIALQQAALDAISTALLSFVPGPSAVMPGAPAAAAAIAACSSGTPGATVLMTSTAVTVN